MVGEGRKEKDRCRQVVEAEREGWGEGKARQGKARTRCEGRLAYQALGLEAWNLMSTEKYKFTCRKAKTVV